MTTTDETLHPFTIDIPQAELDDLHRRLDATRWPAPGPDTGWARGVPPAALRELAGYWRDGYEWRAAEAELNQYPQFTTTVDGTRIHLLHVRSAEPGAFPLLLTHGWPGSIAEFLDVIGPLTDPAAHGGDPADAFHVVVPALPGYGFSGPTPDTGWDSERIARAWLELMTRLGYERFGAQGGDWGSVVSRAVGRLGPDRVTGVHVNTVPGWKFGEIEPRDEDERERLARLQTYLGRDSGYMHIQSRRPQTLGYALTDSPAGQLAWILDMVEAWTDGGYRGMAPDRLLTDVMLYWLTGTAGSSAALYLEEGRRWGPGQPSPVPTAVALFPADISRPIRRVTEPLIGNVVRWTEFDAGGHFAALERPELLVADVREFFRDRRQA